MHNHHKFRVLCWRCWWITIAFPLEHFIWEKLPIFLHISKAMGL